MQQGVFKCILHESRNEYALPVERQTDDELRGGITELRLKWYERPGTQVEHKRYDKLMAEILRRRKERQNG